MDLNSQLRSTHHFKPSGYLTILPAHRYTVSRMASWRVPLISLRTFLINQNLKILNLHYWSGEKADIYGSSSVQRLFSTRTETLLFTSVDLLKPQVIDEVKKTIALTRKKAKSQFDQSARTLPELVYGEPLRLQPPNPKLPCSNGSCVYKVGPRVDLVQTDSGSIYKRN